MLLSLIFIFLILVASAFTLVFLFCMFLPSLKTKYEGLNSFMFTGNKLSDRNLKIEWRIKHLPWAPELTTVNKEKGPQLTEDPDNKNSIVSNIVKFFMRGK